MDSLSTCPPVVNDFQMNLLAVVVTAMNVMKEAEVELKWVKMETESQKDSVVVLEVEKIEVVEMRKRLESLDTLSPDRRGKKMLEY